MADFSPNAVLRYRQGWQALNRLLHEDKSFSGHEKHCAFLNRGDGSFATVSAVVGLDYPEDGRGVGVTDWDFDGQLDLWITNRTAPRVRFLRNFGAGSGGFVAFRLFGDGQKTNRDAIGARVEVTTSQGAKLLRTLFAGDAFLSQSSAWLHFGLGDEAVSQVAVLWPGGGKETFTGVAAKERYLLRQGAGKAERWTPPPSLKPPAPAEHLSPQFETNTRTILSGGLPLPSLEVAGKDGKPAPQVFSHPGPWLINLWSSSCPRCVSELGEWAKEERRIRAKGLDILALNADAQQDGGEGGGAAAKVLRESKFPFAAASAGPGAVRAFDALFRAVLDRWETLPVPCSLLVDKTGYVKALYKGPIDTARLLDDAALLEASPAERRAASSPFAGVWTHDPPAPDPIRVCSQFIDQNQIDAGLAYLQHSVALDQKTGRAKGTDLSDRYFVLATLLREQKQPERALEAYRQAAKITPNDFRVRSDAGGLLEELRRIPEAVAELRAALAIQPGEPEATRRLGTILLQSGQAGEAVPLLLSLTQQRPTDGQAHYLLGVSRQRAGDLKGALASFRQAAALQPTMALAANNAAWIMACHPNAEFRNGAEAVKLAEPIVERTGRRDPNLLSTLAAAYAETGQFQKAQAANQEAIALSKPEDAERLRQRGARYQAKQPHRDSSLAAK